MHLFTIYRAANTEFVILNQIEGDQINSLQNFLHMGKIGITLLHHCF